MEEKIEIDKSIELLKKRIAREVKARREAEHIIEEKSLEIYLANQKLLQLNNDLRHSLAANISALEESNSENFALFENAAYGVVVTVGGIIIKLNQVFCTLTDMIERDLVGKSIFEHIEEKESNFEQLLNDLNNGKIDQFTTETKIINSSFQKTWCKIYTYPIKNKEGQLKYNLSIIDNIQDTKNFEHKQKSLIEQLKEINEQLQNFAHVVSHDLKAPLTGMNTVISWMKNEKDDLTDTHKEYMKLIEDKVSKMYRLIEGVMEYSKVSIKDEEQKEVNVIEVIQNSLQMMVIPSHVRIVLGDFFPTVKLNPSKLEQVFTNLLDNAVRHIDKELGIIEITAYEQKHYWIFKVKDNGKGINNKYLEKIFKIFNTLDKSGKHTGIGLSLVKKIIEQYNGTIQVESDLGIGTTFTFSLDKQTVKN